MSYCVNCGVELARTTAACPLCQTPVINPNEPLDCVSPPHFPTERREVLPSSKRELAILISAMLASVSVCCALLNLILQTQRVWSLYVVGAALMLWVWFVPPLLRRGKPLFGQLAVNWLSVCIYVLLVAMDVGGLYWYWRLALPILCLMGGILFVLNCLIRKRKRSRLSSLILMMGAGGVFALGVELCGDFYFWGRWIPGWSLVVLTISLALVFPLIVVRRVPALREEMRKRFHL